MRRSSCRGREKGGYGILLRRGSSRHEVCSGQRIRHGAGVTHIQTDEAAAAGEAGNDRTALTLSKAVKAGCTVIALERTDTVAGMTTDDIAALKGVLKQYE